MESMEVNTTVVADASAQVSSSLFDESKIFGKCIIEIHPNWQFALYEIYGSEKVINGIWRVLQSLCPAVVMNGRDLLITDLRGSFYDILRAKTELHALIDQLTGILSTQPPLKAASHLSSPPPPGFSNQRHNQLAGMRNLEEQLNQRGANPEPLLVDTSNQTKQPSGGVPSQPQVWVHAQGPSSVTTVNNASVLVTQFLTVNLYTWIYAHMTRNIKLPSGTWWTLNPGINTRESHLEVTSTGSQRELDETMEKIAEMYAAVDRENIVCWPISLNIHGDEKAAQLFQLLQNCGMVLHTADSREYSERWDCLVIGPRRVMPSMLTTVIDWIVQENGSKAIAKTSSSIWPLKNVLSSIYRSVDQESYRFTTSCGLNIHICQGDLTSQRVDAIVSPTDPHLDHGGGASKCIAKAAGHEFTEACLVHVQRNGPLVVSQPIHTSAGNLSPKIKHVIHVVGPSFRPNSSTSIQAVYEPLTETFLNCLNYADKRMELRSLAVPAISAGTFGIPKDVVAKRAFEALLKFNDSFFHTASSQRNLHEVFFVSIDSETVREMVKVFRCLVEATDITCSKASIFYDASAKSNRRHPTRRLHPDSSPIGNAAGSQTPSTNKPNLNDFGHFRRNLERSTENSFLQSDLNSSLTGSVFHGEKPDTRPSSSGVLYARSLGEVTNDFTRIAVFQHSFNFYRCIATFLNPKLRSVRRSPHGNPQDDALWNMETEIAENILSEVSGMLRLMYKAGELRQRNVDPHLTSPSGLENFDSLQKRIDDIQLKYCRKQKVDPLEILAVAFLRKTQIHLFQKDLKGYRLDAKYPNEEYKSRPPITLLYSADVQGFEVLVKNEEFASQSSCDSATSFSENFAMSAAGDDKTITFQQLIGPSLACSAILMDPKNSSIQGGKPSFAGFENLERNRPDSSSRLSASNLDPPGDNAAAGKEVNSNLISSSGVDANRGPGGAVDQAESSSNICVICLHEITVLKKLDCGHVFCTACIDECFEKSQPKCPCCCQVFGVLKGNQPNGKFETKIKPDQSLKGYEQYGTIEIIYTFSPGTQTAEHPHPGQPYGGTIRFAYLPASPEGHEVCDLLERAFNNRLVFTVGQSHTSGEDNCIVWNDIHHKTSLTGQYGYPDPTYLDRVKQELAAKGIVSDVIRQRSK